jgi:hypothetical protein
MASLKNLKLAGLALGAAFLAPALISACSSSNNNQTPPVYGNADAGDATVEDSGSPGSDAEATPDASAPSGDAGDAASSDALLEASTSSDAQDAASDVASDAAPACTPSLTDAGCWVCPSASDGSIEFLNQCYGTGVKCVSFDNTRLPGFDAGLPPLN